MAVEIEIRRIIRSAPQETAQSAISSKSKVDWSTPAISKMSLSLLPRRPREVVEFVWAPLYIGYKLVREALSSKNSSLEDKLNYHFRSKLPEVPVASTIGMNRNGYSVSVVIED